jgi:hypothetical protein
LLGKPTPEPMAFIAAHREGQRPEAVLGKSNSVQQELTKDAAMTHASDAEHVV